jgi:hypothetical protein
MKHIVLLLVVSALFAAGCESEEHHGGYGGYGHEHGYGYGDGYGRPYGNYDHHDWNSRGNPDGYYHDNYRY